MESKNEKQQLKVRRKVGTNKRNLTMTLE